MSLRDDNLIRFAKENGLHEMYTRAYRQVHAKEPQNPQLELEVIVRAMQFVEFQKVHTRIFRYFKKRYNGGTQRFYASGGFALVLYRRKVVAILPVTVLWNGQVPRMPQADTLPPLPNIITQNGVDVPRKATIWQAGLASQLPDRGRSTPRGDIRTRI